MRTRITLNMDIFHAVFSRNFLILFLVFVSWRVVINKIPASGFWLLNIGHKLEKKCWLWRVSFVNFSYWSKFHVNIVTCSGFMTISVYKRLTRNPETGNNHICALANIWRLRRVEGTKFGSNVCNEKLLNVATRQVYSFNCFQVIKGNPAGGENTPTQIRVNK